MVHFSDKEYINMWDLRVYKVNSQEKNGDDATSKAWCVWANVHKSLHGIESERRSTSFLGLTSCKTG
jgi:hypothetical protein